MSNKYIIHNCPAYCYLGKECHNKEGQYGASCCEVTDCVLKRIYKLCKDDYTQFGDKELRYDTLEEIIKLLEIEECEDE